MSSLDILLMDFVPYSRRNQNVLEHFPFPALQYYYVTVRDAHSPEYIEFSRKKYQISRLKLQSPYTVLTNWAKTLN